MNNIYQCIVSFNLSFWYCWITATLLKKRLWHRYLPVNFEKFLRTPFFTEHLRWLPLKSKDPNLLLIPCGKNKTCWHIEEHLFTKLENSLAVNIETFPDNPLSFLCFIPWCLFKSREGTYFLTQFSHLNIPISFLSPSSITDPNVIFRKSSSSNSYKTFVSNQVITACCPDFLKMFMQVQLTGIQISSLCLETMKNDPASKLFRVLMSMFCHEYQSNDIECLSFDKSAIVNVQR